MVLKKEEGRSVSWKGRCCLKEEEGLCRMIRRGCRYPLLEIK